VEEQDIKYSECVSLSLVAQRVKRMRLVTVSYVAHLVPSYFHIVSKIFNPIDLFDITFLSCGIIVLDEQANGHYAHILYR
jgi:hypothetical protein